MTAWTLADDANGDPTLWHGDVAVARPGDLRVPPAYRDVLFAVLVAVHAPDEATVERVAVALYHQRVRQTAELSIRRRPWLELTTQARDNYRGEARAALHAVANTVPDVQAAHVAGVSRALDWAEGHTRAGRGG